MIDNETKDKIYNAIRIEEVVSDYVTLRRRGANLIGLCPFHDERTPSFNVNPARGIFKCFGCGKAGQAVSFVMEMDQCSYPDALRKLAAKYHIEVRETELTAQDQVRHDNRESMFVVNEWAKGWFQEQLWNTAEGQAIGLSYLRQRGLRDETIRDFGLGYCPEKGSPMTQAARAAGYQEEFLVNHTDPDRQETIFNIGTGLSCKSERDGRLFDRFGARIMFPFVNVSGKTVGFAGRIMTDRKDVGKYVNSPESVIYRKGSELYGIHLAKSAIAREDMAYLVEGQMDVISMHQAGIRNVVCSGGTALTEKHVSMLHRFSENITILYDGDGAGIHATLRAIPMFLREGMSVKVMLFPDGDDPDSFSRKHTAEEFVAYISANAVDFVQFQKQVLVDAAGSDLEGRRKAVAEIIQTISRIYDAVSRQLYTQELAQLLGMGVETVSRSVAEARKNYINQVQVRENTQAPQTPIDPAGGRRVPAATLKTQHLEEHFRNIIRMIVRHGNEVFSMNADGTYNPVGAHLINDLRQDNILPEDNPTYGKIMDEYMAHFYEPGFDCAQFFLQHSDPDISRVAADMLADQYANAKPLPQRDDYAKQCVRLLCELKLTFTQNMINGIPARIAAAQNEDERNAVLSEQAQLIHVRTSLKETLRKL